MVMRSILGLVWVFWSVILMAQQEEAWVFLHDKPQADYYLQNPLQMLSSRALERRARYGIALNETDVPLDKNYKAQIAAVPGIEILAKSKWLNCLHVRSDVNTITSLLQLDFVDSIRFANILLGTVSKPEKVSRHKLERLGTSVEYSYGGDTVPYTMHNAYGLHRSGYDGRNVLIAVIDAGFQRADTGRVFAHVYQRNGVVDTYNFPDDTSWVYTRHYHGTVVWSRIAGLEEGVFVGTAPAADYCLYISEDVYQEMPVEETWWAEAAERADSVGADVINTSLGYIDFDRFEYNHTWEQLDGKTAIVSMAAQMATEKGMHVIVSAGNSGLSSWQKIGFPADARDVIAVGAADRYGNRAGFSSTGNTADGRIKPDVMSWGAGTLCYYSGYYYSLSGTSLAAPVITGFMADVVQAYPYIPPATLKAYLLETSDRFQTPDSLYGYGFPQFDRLMNRLENLSKNPLKYVTVFPNPFTENIVITGITQPVSYALYNISGKLIRQGETVRNITLPSFAKGLYILVLTDRGQRRIFKLIKN